MEKIEVATAPSPAAQEKKSSKPDVSDTVESSGLCLIILQLTASMKFCLVTSVDHFKQICYHER